MTRLAAALALLLLPAAALANKVGERATDFTLRDLAGKPVRLSELRGSVVLLDFWASWCAPCKKELPALEALQKKYKDSGKKVVVLTVNIDKDRANAEKFLTAAKVKQVRVLLDKEGAVAGQYDLPTMPTSFVIDAKGIVRYVHAGYRPGDEKKVAAEIETYAK
jgi:thiol-disulfide isomerase/thioredoxin